MIGEHRKMQDLLFAQKGAGDVLLLKNVRFQ